MEETLPKPQDPLGYNKKEILNILHKYKIHHKKFWKAFKELFKLYYKDLVKDKRKNE